MLQSITPSHVVKVSGSLYDLPDLGPRLQRFLAGLAGADVLLVPGGGPTADVVRDLDARHGLGQDKAHWLALRALTLNAHFLASLLPLACVVEKFLDCPRAWQAGRVPILDPHAFTLDDERRPGCLPYTWDATSDSVAARVALVAGARCLILLKSVTVPETLDWTEAGRLGLVDALFAQVVRDSPTLEVRLLNFRAGSP
jgi:aspartokinase-like uncharacterized kinase